MKLTKMISAVLVATILGSALAIVTPSFKAQADNYTFKSTEVEDHYFLVDGKKYTPAAYKKLEATLDAKNNVKAMKGKNPYKVTSIKAKKTGSYVKVTGKVKVSTKSLAKSSDKPNYARIRTYKGYTQVKLTSKLTFKKTIKAPKAKVVHVDVLHYTKTTPTKDGAFSENFSVLSKAAKATVK